MMIWPLVLTVGIITVESRDCSGKDSYQGQQNYTQARFKDFVYLSNQHLISDKSNLKT